MPEEWDDRCAELTHFMKWLPGVVDGMTQTETMRWLEQARRIGKLTGVVA